MLTCIKSIYAKVATSGTVEKPIFENVKILLDRPASNGWFTVKSGNGSEWLCHRSDMVRLFPFAGV